MIVKYSKFPQKFEIIYGNNIEILDYLIMVSDLLSAILCFPIKIMLSKILSDCYQNKIIVFFLPVAIPKKKSSKKLLLKDKKNNLSLRLLT